MTMLMESCPSLDPAPVADRYTSFQAPELQSLWLARFGGSERIRTVGRGAELPLMERRRSLIRTWMSPTNRFLPHYHCPIASAETLAATLRAAQSDIGWDVVEFDLVPEHSPTHRALQQLSADGWRVELRPWQTVPVVNLDQGVEQYLSTRSRNYRKSVRGAENRLARHGKVWLEEVSGRSNWDERLREALRIEAKGWKGMRGTAILQSETLTGFYLELFRRLRERNQFRLYLLGVGARVVAFDALVLMEGTAYSLKFSFDPEFADCGPGNVLHRQEMAQLCADTTLRKLDLGYPTTEWKERICTGRETLLRARIFGDGLLARTLFGARAVARQLRDRTAAPAPHPA